MKIYASNGNIVKIENWARYAGEMKPRQAEKAIKEFNILIDNERITVYYNKSRSNVDYYYLKFNDLWHWTRDDISLNTQYSASR